MNIDDHTPDDDMPGDNIVQSEKQVGAEALKLIRRYETLLNRHDKVLGEIHATIIEFGRKLQAGLDMYGPGREFGDWIKRRHLDKGKLCHAQQERTACMLIARLHDIGVEVDEHDGTTVPCRLDLADCRRTVPTDIMKWAREKQRHLFPHLRPHAAKPVMNSRPRPDNLNDDIPDLTPVPASEKAVCSFCLKNANKVPSLIKAAGSTACICNECVDLCVRIIAEHAGKGGR